MNWEPVIGLEIHAQLNTKSKLFSASSTDFFAPENANVNAVDAGLPGSLPVLNSEAVAMAVKAGLALNCTINPVSIWARKHYFYPDLPKGYQISQYERPLCTAGWVTVAATDKDGKPYTKKIGIHRIHMEEDAGKNIHEAGATWVNLNRAGVPLIEIVSEPDLRTADEAAAYMKKIRAILRYAGVCDGNMEQGSLRCDVNVSIRPRGQEKFGTKVELKNINSFKFVERAIAFEVQRQIEMFEAGKAIVQETRSFDAVKGTTFTMRMKEDAHDYRYFPEPDLPPLRLPSGFVEKIKKDLPELPDAKRDRLVKDYALPEYDAEVLSSARALSDYFETVAKGLKNPKNAANWIMTAVLREVSAADIDSADQIPVSAKNLHELIALIENETISGKIAKQVYEQMLTTKDSPSQIVKEKGLVQISDDSLIEKEIEAVLAAHVEETKALLEGKDKLMGFFIGQLMRRMQGKANPKVVQDVFQKLIQKKKGSS
jgi:aspartyl-tRNA(Asn)/glutamyl-tRNA(Gln) amidotransferase subunit B